MGSDITKALIVSIASLSGKRENFKHLVGREVIIDHDELLIAELNKEGINLTMVDNYTSLIINGIESVRYDYSGIDFNVIVRNENYEYVFEDYESI